MIKGDALFNILKNVLATFQLFILSIIVVQLTSLAVWGDFIRVYLICTLIVMLINTGSKEFLITAISHTPTQQWQLLYNHFWFRFLLLLAIVPGLFLFAKFNVITLLIVLIMIFIRTILSSVDGLVVYDKAFNLSFYVELFSLFMLLIMLITAYNFTKLNTHVILLLIIFIDTVKLFAFNHRFKLFRYFRVQDYSFLKQVKSITPYMLIGIIGFVMNKADLYVFTWLSPDKESVAVYHILNTLTNGILIIISSMILVRSKVFFRMPLSLIKPLQFKYLLYSSAIIMFCLGLFYAVAPIVFKYNVGVLALLLIGLNGIVFSQYVILIYLNLRFNQIKNNNLIIGVAGCTQIAATFLLVPVFNVEGALSAVLLSNLIVGFGLRISTAKYLP